MPAVREREAFAHEGFAGRMEDMKRASLLSLALCAVVMPGCCSPAKAGAQG